MVSFSTLFRYVRSRMEYAAVVSFQNCRRGQATKREVYDSVWKNFFLGKLTRLLPTKGAPGGILLVRKIPLPDPTHVFVGDAVVLKDPENSGDYLVRNLAAIEGYEMVSKGEKEEPFVLEKGECWVLTDNENINPEKAKDSRSFGPVPMSHIVGRVIYFFTAANNHGPVRNSHFSLQKDKPILEFELDVDEMLKTHKRS